MGSNGSTLGNLAGYLTDYSAELAAAAADYAGSVTKANLQLLTRSSIAAGKLAGEVFQTAAAEEAFTVHAAMMPSPDRLRVDTFIQRSDTPGNVAVCLSGGGSRSMIASMGQLRGLKALGLLGKVKALSTVSGGSWAAIPFMYLPEVIPEDNFLNEFVEDPARLSLTGSDQRNMAAALDYLPPGNLGAVAASPAMSVSAWAVQAWELLFVRGVLPRQLWTRLIGDSVLSPFGLSAFGSDNLPHGYFTYDEQTRNAILQQNPDLNHPAYLYRRPQGAGDVVRPFHLCNTSMFIAPDSKTSVFPDGMQLLAPVQSTAFFTGILPTGLGLDAAGLPVGGGGVTSLAFGGQVVARPSPDRIETKTRALFALSDITGMSSAFFASLLADTLPALGIMDPGYSYWPVDVAAAGEGTLNRFADGGDLEDNGVASMLAYEDIDRLIVFVNSTPLDKDGFGNIKIDAWLPTLFGYTPYHAGTSAASSGYTPYRDSAGRPTPGIRQTDLYFQHNQVFPSDRLQPLLDAVWQNSGAGTNENPAVFHQAEIDVLPNPWFGVRGGRKVDVLWVILNPVESWTRQLRPEVQDTLSRDFPNYNILRIHQSAVDVNLLAHQTAWTTHQQAGLLMKMFE